MSQNTPEGRLFFFCISWRNGPYAKTWYLILIAWQFFISKELWWLLHQEHFMFYVVSQCLYLLEFLIGLTWNPVVSGWIEYFFSMILLCFCVRRFGIVLALRSVVTLFLKAFSSLLLVHNLCSMLISRVSCPVFPNERLFACDLHFRRNLLGFFSSSFMSQKRVFQNTNFVMGRSDYGELLLGFGIRNF